MELAYQSFGTAEYEVVNHDSSEGSRKVEVDAISALLTGQYNYQRIFAFAKIGAAYAQTELDQKGLTSFRQPEFSDVYDMDETYDDIAPVINFGAGVLLGDFVELYVAYQQIFGEGPTDDYLDDSVLALPSELTEIKMVNVGINIGDFRYRLK